MSSSTSQLLLHEQILLLALRDRVGTPESGVWHGQAIGGAILAELLLAERIDIDPGKRALVSVVDPKPTGDAALDACLGRIASAGRRASAQAWVGRFAGRRDVFHEVARGLCRKGVLKQDEASVLLIFKRTVYPEIDPAPERELVECLREAIFGEAHEVDPEVAVLATIANAAELLKVHFKRKDLKTRKARLEQLASGELVGRATRQAVQAAQAAIVAACVIPTVIITS